MMPTSSIRAFLLVPLVLLGLAACAESEAPLGQLPDGWRQDGRRWWTDGTDTAAAFRNLGTLEEMGFSSGVTYGSTRELARQAVLQRGQLKDAVKRSIIRLYRNSPEVVDSLFEHDVAPQLESLDLRGDPGELVERSKKRAYNTIRRHFREPQPALKLGEDVPVTYPDSLRSQGITGAVRMQVRIDAEGGPVGIRLIEGVHPVLNEIAMRATTNMRWRPAYLLVKKNWKEIPSWAIFTIRFGA